MARHLKDVQHIVAYPQGVALPQYFALLNNAHDEFAPRVQLCWTDVVERPDVIVLANDVRFALPDRVEIWAWALCLGSYPGARERIYDFVYVERVAKVDGPGFVLPTDFGIGAGALGLQITDPNMLKPLLPRQLVEPPLLQFPDLSKI